MLINKVLPAIQQKFPSNNKNVVIQQDGAKVQILEDDDAFLTAGSADSWNITVCTQPARSPKVNINDLAFFRSRQSRYWLLGYSKDVDDIITKLQQAYNDYPVTTIEKSWVTFASVLDEMICSDGKNDFKIPRMGKDAILNRDGRLPVCLPASEESLIKAQEYVDDEQRFELEELARLARLLEEWDEEDTPDV